MFSRRTDHERAPNEVALATSRARADGRVLVDLALSNPNEAGLGLAAADVLAPLANPEALLHRPSPGGGLAARERVARELGVPASRVVLTASTSEAYAHAFTVLCDPGDRVLVPRPSYPLLEWLARLGAVELVPYDVRYDGAWYVDLESVDRALAGIPAGGRAGAIVVVSPNNPTGHVLESAERDALLARGVPLVIDEVFAGYPLDASSLPELPPAATGLELRLSGLSKRAALPQMKLAFVSVGGDDALVTECLARFELVLDTFLSTSTPIELAVAHWLDRAPAVRAAITARCRENLAALDAALAGSAATRLRASGGWYATLRVPNVIDEDRYCLALLERGVVVQPGWYFDFAEPAFLVLSLLPEPGAFARAASMLARVVADASDGSLR